jgi:hypothetical protein
LNFLGEEKENEPEGAGGAVVTERWLQNQ